MLEKKVLLIKSTESKISGDDLPSLIGKAALSYEERAVSFEQFSKSEKSYDAFDLVLLHLDQAFSNSHYLKAFLKNLDGKIPCIGLGTINSVDYYRALKGIGFTDYVALPLKSNFYSDAVLSALGLLNLSERSLLTAGEKIGVIAAKGGLGASTFTANIAHKLAHEHAKKVAAIEVSLLQKDLSYFFGQPVNQSIIDFNVETNFSTNFENAAKKVDDNLKLYTVSPPISSTLSTEVLHAFTSFFDVVSDSTDVTLVDLSHLANPYLIENLGKIVDQLVFIIDNSVSSLANFNLLFSLLNNDDRDKVVLVQNFTNLWSKAVVNKEIMKENIKATPSVTFRCDQANGLSSLNTGELLYTKSKNFNKSLTALLEELGYKDTKKQSWLSALMK